ncbi:hypothetical protein [Pseudooceanicola nanhaiensis]|uniref:hypothetical protein n=1 Tax=Pseudooceanicola nanhaiensis TaxID=375761 RepID=UPI003519BED1
MSNSIEDWLPYATLSNAVSTLAIAWLTLALFRMQRRENAHAKKVAEANYKFQLFQKRLEVYFAVREYYVEFYKLGSPSMEAASRVHEVSLTARYLMGDDVQKFLISLRDHAFDFRSLERKDERYQSKINRGGELNEEENAKHQQLLDQMQAIEMTVGQLCTVEKLDEVFTPYLKMPDSLESR